MVSLWKDACRATSVCALRAQCWGHFLLCNSSGNSTQEENSVSVWCVTMAMSQVPALSGPAVNRSVSAQLQCWKRSQISHLNLNFAFSNRPWHPVETLFVWLDAMAVYQRLWKKRHFWLLTSLLTGWQKWQMFCFFLPSASVRFPWNTVARHVVFSLAVVGELGVQF